MSGLSSVTVWLLIGFLGQLVFTARFLVQWIASERKRDSVVPIAFWWLSLLGGMTLLSYAIHRQDPVIIVGQALGVFVYVRNLMLVGRKQRKARRRARRSEQASSRIPRHHLDQRPVAADRIESESQAASVSHPESGRS